MIYINDVEEEDHQSGDAGNGDSGSHRSMINEDQERRGELLSSQNVSPQILSAFMSTPPSGLIME